MSRFPFIGPTYESFSLNADAQRAVNLYPEAIESGTGKNNWALYGTPGLRLFKTLPTSPVRGLWANEDRLFVAAGSRLYEVFQNATYQDRGEIGDDAAHSPVQMFPNGNQLFIVSAGLAYVDTGTEIIAPNFGTLTGTVDTNGTGVAWVSGDTFDLTMFGQPITIDGVAYTVAAVRSDGKFLTLTSDAGVQSGAAYSAVLALTAGSGAFLDGYFIVARPSTKQFNLSALYDGWQWDPLDHGIKQGYPDNILAILADHEELWLFGTDTIEVWRNTGNSDFPFERDGSAFIQQGLVAQWSPARLNNGVAWLGGDPRGRPVAWRAQGYMPARVSNHAIEQKWQSYSTVADAISYAYRDQGHEFWALSFPTANATWVLDALTGMWHERAYWNGSALGRHRGRCHSYVWGKHFVGDHETGAIYEMATTLYDDAGQPIHRVRAAPHLSDEQGWMFYSRFQLDKEVGTGESEDTLDWSDDGGHNWKAPQVAPTVAAGEYLRRVIWRRLGRSRDRIFRVTSIAEGKVAWVNAYLDVQKGTS